MFWVQLESIKTLPEKRYKRPTDYRNLYFWLNACAVSLHILNAIAVGIAHERHLKHIKKGYLFFSPTVDLHWTNHALVRVDSNDNKCLDVGNSQHFIGTSPAFRQRCEASLFLPRDPFPDFVEVFNFTGTDLIQYNREGASISLNMTILTFFILSAVFQTIHGVLLYYYDDIPRFLHYLEYAFSSPLMVMVMAVEVGIIELFLVIALGGLFFGMNIAGMCAEILTQYAGYIYDSTQSRIYWALCWLVHFTGWVLFLLAMVPIWLQFHYVIKCSENGGTPDHVYALIIVESFFFFLFGFLQVVSIMAKLNYVYDLQNDDCYRMTYNNYRQPITIPAQLLFRYDCVHALLSLVAKTILAWLLLGPALLVDLSVLKERISSH